MENTDFKGTGSYGQQQTTTVIAAPQQTVMVQQSHGNTAPNLAVGSCRGLGIGQLVCGVMLILLAVILLSLGSHYTTLWNLFTSGIFSIITGSLGIGAATNQNRCLITATLVLSVLSSLAAFGLLPGTIIALVWGASIWPPLVAICVIILLVAVTEMILAIIHTVVCCRAVCCGYQQQPRQAVYYYGQSYAQNQPMAPTGQPYMVNQPMAPAGQPYMMANQPMAPAGQPYMVNQPMAPTEQVAYAPNQPVAATGQYYPQNPPSAPVDEKGY
ncbi:uncharacterized protein [Ptychodera flava]|uniref:uncharacterized protein n=1 Tax=Ptychodera flava TaxID=63121 RepID=UPI00396A9A72